MIEFGLNNKFLGIRYNKWHGVIALLLPVLIFLFLWLMFSDMLKMHIDPGFRFVLFHGLGIVIAHHLQSWNEARQAIDNKLIPKYGSWRNFVNDSKEDWRWFWRGIFGSWTLSAFFTFFL